MEEISENDFKNIVAGYLHKKVNEEKYSSEDKKLLKPVIKDIKKRNPKYRHEYFSTQLLIDDGLVCNTYRIHKIKNGSFYVDVNDQIIIK